MSTQNIVLMKQTRTTLQGKWGLAIGTFVVYILILTVIQMIPSVGAIAGLLLSGPMILGAAMFSLSLSRNEDARFDQIFQGFNIFITALATYFLMIIFILLWLLLFIVPGIIAALGYSMTFYILADNPTLNPMVALSKSKEMMMGYKKKLFYLALRFFGLGLLCILTLGIGFLWLMPYVNVCMARFYDDIK